MPQANNIPLINGVAYDWGQIVVNVLGSRLFGITGVTYDEDQTIEDNFGAGNFSVERGFGQIEYTGALTLQMKEIELLTNIAPNRRIQNIPEFDIIVSYLNDNAVVTHTLKNCRFKNNGREVAQGDTMIEKELTLAIGNIQW
jgi:hypothetical protein